MKRLACLAVFALAGCVSAPPAIDPFVGLRNDSKLDRSAYRNLSVAVFISKNTENTLEYARSRGVARSRGPFGRKVPEFVARLASDFIPRQFKSAVKIDRLEDAASVQADVVAVLDVRAEGAIHTLKHTTIDVALIFTTPDGRPLDAVKGSGDRKLGFPDTPNAMGAICDQAMAEAQAALENALFTSGPLLAFARTKGGGTAAVAAAPPAAAAPPPAPTSDIDRLPAAGVKPDPKAHAIVIGIERYREKLPAADFAAADARLAAEYFKRVLGVPEENLALLVDDRAAKADFEKYFERWLPNRVEKGARVYVYYSGHGAPNPSTGDAYLVPFDADPTYIDQTGYSIKRVYEQLAKLPAESSVVMMDSCFSGAGGRSVIAQGARPLVTTVETAVPGSLTVLTASSREQISNSYRDKGHGLFTYFLLKGLKEKGLDWRGVFDYLKPEVARVARREYNADQEPQWRDGR